MKPKTITHKPTIQLFQRIIADTGVDSSGTYNQADPTHFERGMQDFEYKGGKWRFSYNDCTWGVEVSIGHYRGGVCREIWGFYISRDTVKTISCGWITEDSIIPRQANSKGAIVLLARSFKRVLSPIWVDPRIEDYESDGEPMHCPSMYI